MLTLFIINSIAKKSLKWSSQMQNDLYDFLALALISYFITIGFGLVVAQARDAKAVHRFWTKLVTGSIAFVLKTIGDIFHWLAKGVR